MTIRAPGREKEQAGPPPVLDARIRCSWRVRRWALAAGLCFSIGCVQGRCYQNVDCPSPQVCVAGGACVLRDDSLPPDKPSRVDAGNDGVAWGPVDAEVEVETGADPGIDAESTADTVVDAAWFPGCPPFMAAIGNFCIDLYEASRVDATATSAGRDGSRACVVAGVLPWLVGDNAEAALGCEAAGKRLCSPVEWQLACEGPDQTTYAYGDRYNATTCNGIDAFANYNFHLTPTGSFSGCTNAWGVFDMNGNAWEHVAGGTDLTVRGGAYNCSDSVTYHRCDYVPTTWNPSAKGFRCCTDGNAP
jgi:hypothetical protein